MIGAAYESTLKGLKSTDKFDLVREQKYHIISLLGNIIQMNRSVLEQREYVQIQYEKFTEGTLEDDAFGISRLNVPEDIQNHKRKRSKSSNIPSDDDKESKRKKPMQ